MSFMIENYLKVFIISKTCKSSGNPPKIKKQKAAKVT